MIMSKKISEMEPEDIKSEVRTAYTRVAERTDCCSGKSTGSSCCGENSEVTASSLAKALGYSIDQMPSSLTESFAGCGNPVALASLQEGEVVLDLGSGAGLDVMVAAKKVGMRGRVLGIDMTPAMLEKAEANARKLGVNNVEFRLGEIEEMPVEDNSIDAVISNCVINLSPQKSQVFSEIFRVLKPGGRVMISDIVLSEELPNAIREDVKSYAGCVGGAILDTEYLQLMRDAGLVDVEIAGSSGKGPWTTYSAYITGRKPNHSGDEQA